MGANMRTSDEMISLILSVAEKDDRIRAVGMGGSRANPECPPDAFQDFDITYFVDDVSPFWDNDRWIKENFGTPSLMQKPESMHLISPDDNGTFVYLMLFPDGNRIDLCIKDVDFELFEFESEPMIVLLDKDSRFEGWNENLDRGKYWHIKEPTDEMFANCCNEFHWCMNNVAKGIARDEVNYAMKMLNHYVRDMLTLMLEWYVGAANDFNVSAGKEGKWFKHYLPPELYESLLATFSTAETEAMWNAAFEMLRLFETAALFVAEKLNFIYDVMEKKGITDYMKKVRAGKIK